MTSIASGVGITNADVSGDIARYILSKLDPPKKKSAPRVHVNLGV